MNAPFFLVPGQQELPFKVKRKDSTTTNGRVSYNDIEIGLVEGTISDATQRQKYEWNQMNHPITHTIVVNGTCDVKAEDILEDEQYLNYHVQGVSDPSNLGFFTIIYCKSMRWDNAKDSQDPDNQG